MSGWLTVDHHNITIAEFLREQGEGKEQTPTISIERHIFRDDDGVVGMWGLPDEESDRALFNHALAPRVESEERYLEAAYEWRASAITQQKKRAREDANRPTFPPSLRPELATKIYEELTDRGCPDNKLESSGLPIRTIRSLAIAVLSERANAEPLKPGQQEYLDKLSGNKHRLSESRAYFLRSLDMPGLVISVPRGGK